MLAETKKAVFLQRVSQRKPVLVSTQNHAEVAESVDASVSKTDEVTLVPVRSRPSVLKTPLNHLIWRVFLFVGAQIGRKFQRIIVQRYLVSYNPINHGQLFLSIGNKVIGNTC